MNRRLLVVVLGVVLALVGGVAFAAWLSAGAGLTSASATTVARAAQPSVSLVAGKVTISWNANSAPVDRYDVYRHSTTGTSTLLSSCTGVTSTTCTDTTPAAGSVTYGVVARVGTYWQGQESPLSQTFNYDSTAPSTAITRNPNGTDTTWNATNVSVTLTATDAGSGVKEIRYTVGSGSEQVVTVAGAPATASTTFVLAQEAANSLRFWSVDQAGNEETPHKSATVNIDKTAPSAPTATVAPSSPDGSNGYYKSGTTVTLEGGTDSGSGIDHLEYQANATSPGGWSTYTAAISVPDSSGYTLYSRSVDKAGNVSGNASTTLKVDTTPPPAPVASLSPTNPNGVGGWYKTAPSVSLAASADVTSGVDHIEYQLNGTGGPWTTYGAAVSVPNGTTTVYYRSVDKAGNASTAGNTGALKVDNVAPANLATSPASSSTIWNAGGQVTLSATDAGGSTLAGFHYSVDGTSKPDLTSAPYSFTLSEGSHTIAYQAFDGAGNTTSGTTATIKVDATAPEFGTIFPTAGGVYNSGSAPWSFASCATGLVCADVTDAGSGASTVTFTIASDNGKCWDAASSTFQSVTPCTAPQPMNLATGSAATGTWKSTKGVVLPTGARSYTMVVTATDAAGLIRSTSNITFTSK